MTWHVVLVPPGRYLSRDGELFVKRFAVDPARVYGEVAGLTCCIFYYRDRLAEIEPIGPLEHLRPGQSASFTEHWSLVPFEFPANGTDLDLDKVNGTRLEFLLKCCFIAAQDPRCHRLT